MKNVTPLDDILGTARFPLNEVAIMAGFIENYFAGLKISRANDRISFTKDGKKVSFAIERGHEQDTGYVRFEFAGRKIRFFYGSKKELADTILMIKNEFLSAESGWLDVKGRDVVDIGAYVADTAIFFSIRGARHVYAIEPYPYFYKLGKKNVLANKMGGKITMLNVAVASRRGKVGVDASHRGFSGKGFKAQGDERQLAIVSLEDIVKKYKLSDAALKVDCEGGEYDIMLNASDGTLRRFEDIEVEYHYGYLNIEERLRKAGFEVERHKPMKRFNFGTGTVMVNGFIHARRIGK